MGYKIFRRMGRHHAPLDFGIRDQDRTERGISTHQNALHRWFEMNELEDLLEEMGLTCAFTPSKQRLVQSFLRAVLQFLCGVSGVIQGGFYFHPIEQRSLAGGPGDEKAT